ncbi:MAG: hypothetical protein AB7L84_03200, partial [Acidimicrobiia bacterium]
MEVSEGVGGHAAPPARRTTRPWTATLLITAGCVVTQGFGRLSFGLVLPDITEDILGSYSGAGIAVMANMGAQFVGLFCVIALSRRFDAATLVKAGLVGTIAGMAGVNVATSYAV